MKKTIYLETYSTDPAYNLAFEEYVLTNKKDGDYLLLWQNDNAVIVGKNQNTEAEVNHSFVKDHGIRVVRRTTGGGAVYHDMGNLNYSFITNVENAEEWGFDRFTVPVVETLKKLGLDASASGRNDILVSGKKVSGTAQRITGNRILHHGTLLFETNPEILECALNADPEKYQSKGAKSVKARVGNIRDYLPAEMTIEEFWEVIKEKLSEHGTQHSVLSEEECAEVFKLKVEKYDTWEWNFGKSPAYTMKNRKRFDGGCLEACIQVAKGKIDNIKFYGDFLSRKDADEICYALIGKNYTEDAVRDVLHGFLLYDFFGSITENELIETIFNYE